MSAAGAEFAKALSDGYLYFEDDRLSWRVNAFRTRATAEAVISGTPGGVHARLVVQVGQTHDSLSATILWNDERIRGMDLTGPPHTDLTGHPIRPPHRHWLRTDGAEETEAIDLAAEGIIDDRSAFEHFVRWCGLEPGQLWVAPPPLQGALGGGAVRKQRKRGRG